MSFLFPPTSCPPAPIVTITGIALTNVADPIGFTSWSALAFSPSLSRFVAVADTTNVIQISSDGVTWTNPGTTIGSRPWAAMDWSPTLSLFVAVANDVAGAAGQVSTSPDGTTWTARNSASNIPWRCVRWIPFLSKFIAVSSVAAGSPVAAMSSTDGINWINIDASKLPAREYLTVFGSDSLGVVIAAGDYGLGADYIAKSTDGINWSLINGPSTGNITDGCWAEELGLFVMTNGSGNIVTTSPDGNVWTDRACPSGTWQSVTWCRALGMFIAVDSNNLVPNQAMYSTDGINWQLLNSGTQAIALKKILWAETVGAAAAVGSDLTTNLVTCARYKWV